MRFKPPDCKRLQGVADARRRVRRRTFVPQVPDNKADAVPFERLRYFSISDTETDHIVKDQENQKNSERTRVCVVNIRFCRLGMPSVAPFT
jgi:hypothetical protein